MASPSSPQHEPTMEEILASIRKIISEDSTEPQPAAPAAAAPAPAPVQAEADVLELTQEIEEVPQPAPQPAPPPQPVQAAAPAPEPVRPAPQDDVVFQSMDEPVVVPTPAVAAAPAPSAEGFVSEKARSAVDDALSAIDFGSPEPHNTAPVAPLDGLSVEAVFDRAVRETFEPVLRAWLQAQASVIVDRMKPAIREWMDDNLPDMLKAAVEAEVARAVKARTTRR